MSEALVKTNPQFLTVFQAGNKNKCPHGFIRGAQDLAAILQSRSGFGSRSFGWNGNSDGLPPPNVFNQKGLICYMKIPGFGGQGHIDLWEGDGPVGTAYWDAKTIWMWRLP
jgi:hypothetical protein